MTYLPSSGVYHLPFISDSTEYTVDKIWDEYKDIVISKNELVSGASEIMKEISIKMKKTPKAARLTLQRHYKKICPKPEIEEKILAVAAVTPKLENSNDVDDSCHNSNESNSNSNEANKRMTSFNKTFGAGGATIFETELRMVKHRKNVVERKSVKPGWTSKLALFLWKETELSCKFDFKVAYFTNRGTEIKVNAACECGSVVDVSCRGDILCVDIKNINESFEHKRRYQATGELKKSLLDQLKHSTALQVQTKVINELNPDNEKLKKKFIPVMQTLNTYRVMACKAESTQEDPMDVLLEWKETIYKNVISLISHAPFTIHYRTSLQLAWYIAESKTRRMCISIDATGKLVKPPKRSQKIEGCDKLKHVFLYAVMVKTDSKSLGIAQMITQDQTYENIEYFLKKMFKSQVKPPGEVVCDESKALIKALVSTFTTCDGIVDYVRQCMSSLQTGAPPPTCQIRYDRSHFVTNTSRKIKDPDQRKQNFYRCVVGYLIQCDDFGLVKKILGDFFTIILNPYDGCDESNQPLPAEVSRTRLQRLVGTHESVLYEDEDVTNDFIPDDDDGNIHADSDWIEDIIDRIDIITTESSHQNVYYNPKAKDFYIKLFSTVSLYSNIMNKAFGSTASTATSSDVESSFNSLKNNILAGEMLNAHQFLRTHIDFVNAQIKLGAISSGEVSIQLHQRKRSNSMTEMSVTPIKNLNRSNSMSEISPIKNRSWSDSNNFEQSPIVVADGEDHENVMIEKYFLMGFITLFHSRGRKLEK